jgi:hypothetical protein
MSLTFVLKKQVTFGIFFVGEDCTGFPKIWAVVQLNHSFCWVAGCSSQRLGGSWLTALLTLD